MIIYTILTMHGIVLNSNNINRRILELEDLQTNTFDQNLSSGISLCFYDTPIEPYEIWSRRCWTLSQ